MDRNTPNDPLPHESNSDKPPTSNTASAVKAKAPTHPGIISVQTGVGDFSTRAVSLISLPPGAVLTTITGITPHATRSYTTVQSSRTSDIELNSDLVYSNHSCRPSVVFDMARMEVRVVDGRPLRAGEDITFFYPSTEWDMQQPFECGCGAGEGVCLGTVRGARWLGRDVLERYWMNQHVRELLEERDGGAV